MHRVDRRLVVEHDVHDAGTEVEDCVLALRTLRQADVLPAERHLSVHDHAVGRAVYRPGLEPEGLLEERHRLLAIVVAEHRVEALNLRVSHGQTIRDTPGS